MSLSSLLEPALKRREALFEKLHAEKTDAYRLFHGVAEGKPGLTIDRYGSLILVQTFRDPLVSDELPVIEAFLRKALSNSFTLTYNHRDKSPRRPDAETSDEIQCREFGLYFLIRARHPGIDPWLFLDLRAGRRFVRENAKGLSVLNLFSYTCSVGVTAAAAGAKDVWNIDFASSNLEVGRKNALLNHIPENRFRTIEEDCLPVMRQLAGLPPGIRRGRATPFKKFEQRQFDLVFLDPPAWSKGSFGAVDVAGDYAGLFKPAVLATVPGGKVIATNHVASIEWDEWIDSLKRCAAKAGRPIRTICSIPPEADFPSFDGRPPLKIAVCDV